MIVKRTIIGVFQQKGKEEMTTALPRVLVTRKLPAEVEQRLARDFAAALNADDHVMSPDEIIAKAAGVDALLVTPGDKCRADFLGRLPPSIKAIATFSVGFDHIDVPAAKAKGLVVTNTPDVLTDATADIAMLLILGAARGAYWGERMVRVDAAGKPSVSHFVQLQPFAEASLCEIHIETGRTHQIRVHASHIGHAVAGDEKYGDRTFNQRMKEMKLKRLFLHAARFEFEIGQLSFAFSAPMPPELGRVIDALQALNGAAAERSR